jgi:Spy/CpxP family protein refolding chaperone
MFGIFIGTACLIGLAVVLRRGRYGYECGPGGGQWGRRGGRFGFGRRGLYRIFQKLETTPGQEKVILSAISDLKEHARDARAGMRGTVNEVAEALRGEDFDDDAFAAIFEPHLSRIENLRSEFARTVHKIHEVLAPEQRDRLADFIESRARFAHVL